MDVTLERLTEPVLKAVDEYGFCVLPSIIQREHALELRSLIDDLRRREQRPDVEDLGHQRVLHLAAKHAEFANLLCHPLCMAICEKYLGADFLCSTWTSNTALPGSDLTYWHVDHPYWTISSPYPVNPPLTAHAIWCLDDFSENNGATRVVPRSHRRTNLPEHKSNHDDESVTIEAAAGTLIVAHGAIWHSGGRNRTDRPRTGIFARYARSYIVLQEDLKGQLAAIPNPSPLIERLMGKTQYVPQRNLPY
jgi:ectoine hydroxylase-related dioxygenase (phytanoyl-CoA dioxygenase family)